MASASLPHQGRFAPLRGAQEGILDPSARPPPCKIAGTGRGTGFFRSEQGTRFSSSRALGRGGGAALVCVLEWLNVREGYDSQEVA